MIRLFAAAVGACIGCVFGVIALGIVARVTPAECWIVTAALSAIGAGIGAASAE